jgi:hypothetical protein
MQTTLNPKGKSIIARNEGEDMGATAKALLLGIDLGAPQRLGDGDLTEIGGRHAAEGAVEGADRRPRGADDHDIGHGVTPPADFR